MSDRLGLGLPRALWLIVLAGGVLRVVWVLAHPVDPIQDFLEYHDLARGLAFDGYYGYEGDPSAWRGPGWPLLLAGAYWLFGGTFTVGALTTALVSTATIIPAAVIATQLLGPRLAIATTAAVAFLPTSIFYSTVLGSEHLAQLLMVTMLALMVACQPSVRIGLALGLLEGALLLSRSESGIAMGAVLALYLVMHRSELQRTSLAAGMAALATILVLTPWVIRNESVFGEFIPLSTNGGFTFHLGTLDAGYTRQPIFEDLPPADQPRAQDSFYWDRSLENIRDDPVRWLKFDVERFAMGFGSDVRILAWAHVAPAGSALFQVVDGLSHLVMLLAAVGVGFLLLRPKEIDSRWFLVATAVVLTALIKIVFLFDGRHRVPLIAALTLLAGLGVQQIYEAIQRRRELESA